MRTSVLGHLSQEELDTVVGDNSGIQLAPPEGQKRCHLRIHLRWGTR